MKIQIMVHSLCIVEFLINYIKFLNDFMYCSTDTVIFGTASARIFARIC